MLIVCKIKFSLKKNDFKYIMPAKLKINCNSLPEIKKKKKIYLHFSFEHFIKKTIYN